ncbi:uncharacterized protein SCHCODRAFT_02627619 [Schizophyllum commune H4-8]|uniref:uncharacterized protein n=1 Tax=Schizophyllum commune (strain H4-8 / FGSC 9210) TaxID=578458 RepID=UPI00215F91DE|nr:uncharacterized protein SCHCODRAFT_02627619 [Schizophyllum commune H4-8]KAI5890903.1 hypothetical protein SCHCODRAFT_02627619 [Schizophyllum commune H4-8]
MAAVLECAPATTDNGRETRRSVQGVADVGGCSPADAGIPLLAAPYDPLSTGIVRASSVPPPRTAYPSSRVTSPTACAAAPLLLISAVHRQCIGVSDAQNVRELEQPTGSALRARLRHLQCSRVMTPIMRPFDVDPRTVCADERRRREGRRHSGRICCIARSRAGGCSDPLLERARLHN